MSFAWIAAGTAIASVGMGAYSMATAPGMPDAPDLAKASRAGTEAEARMLPMRRMLESAARQGTSVTIPNYPAHDAQQRFVKVDVGWEIDKGKSIRNQLLGGFAQRKRKYEEVPYVASEWQPGGKYADKGTPDVFWKTVHIPEGPKSFDFSGYGEAEVQGKVARDMAQLGLDLNKKYGSQFIEESLKQQELADPEGKAAREKLYELIQRQAGDDPERPVADLLDRQVSSQLSAGKNLDATSSAVLDEAIRQALASRGGGDMSGTAWADPLTTGFEGQQRLDAAQQKALGWLSSGATPEDVDYRRGQQTLSNLSSFAQGKTPQSQFAAMSGAQQGPAPMQTGPRLPSGNGSTGQATQNAAMQTWGTQMNNASNQASPWMAGLSMLLSGTGAIAKAP